MTQVLRHVMLLERVFALQERGVEQALRALPFCEEELRPVERVEEQNEPEVTQVLRYFPIFNGERPLTEAICAQHLRQSRFHIRFGRASDREVEQYLRRCESRERLRRAAAGTRPPAFASRCNACAAK